MLFMPTPVRVIAAGGGGSSVTDDFNRANEDLEDSPNWSLVSGGTAGTIGVVSNQASGSGSSLGAYTFDAFSPSSADYWAEMVVVNPQNTTGYFPCVRLVDTSNLIGTRIRAGGAVNLLKRVGGSNTILASSVGTVVDGDVLRVEAEGNVARVFINGVQAGSDASLGGDLSAAGSAGLRISSTTSGAFADDFSAGE